ESERKLVIFHTSQFLCMESKSPTFLEYTSRINRVIDYIYANQEHGLTVETLPNEACFSRFHFQKIFKMIVGESLNVYIRRRRLKGVRLDFTGSSTYTGWPLIARA
ncbi:AraC family transcriptional regulator, partial [bacterium]|nr:AraC family transcriptional regulator [bacterium]